MAERANDIQFGGDHYKRSSYEHWDFVVDADLDYFQGCATKYPARWRSKGGILDLKKSRHYVQKAREVGRLAYIPGHKAEIVDTFVTINKLTPIEAEAVRHIVEANWDEAEKSVTALIEAAEAEAATQPESQR